MIKAVCDSAKCSGCFACVNICPVSAIQMHPGKIGHLYPLITDKCIECGKCQKICPANNPVDLQEPLKTYAFWVKDDNEHRTSTSGGAAACFTNYILKGGGIVYGCASLPDGIIEHVRISKVEDAPKLKGSKYVHSHINEIFRLIKKDLLSGYKVLFIGLPCQVAGLKNYIGGNSNELYTVDLICHGVPSQQVLFEYLSSIGIERSNIKHVTFRESHGYYLSVQTKTGKDYRKHEALDLYYMAFNDNLCFRDSCYTCPYSTLKRCGDITIGDFWGLGQNVPFDHNPNGNVSVVLVNNHKGAQLIEQTAEGSIAVERTLNEAVSGNHNLKSPSVPTNYQKFVTLYDNLDIKNVFKKCLLLRRVKAPLIPIVQWIYKKIK